MASKLGPFADNVPIVRQDGTPTPEFVRQLETLLAEKAVTDSLAEGALPNTASSGIILGRATAGDGVVEELTLSQALDLIGSAAQGDLLYRGSAGWQRLPAGTSGQFLKTLGAGADPAWASVSGGGGSVYVEEAHNNISQTASVDHYYVPNSSGSISTSASSANNLKVTFTVTSSQTVLVQFFAILARATGASRLQINDTSGTKVWPKNAADTTASHNTVYSKAQGESDGHTVQFTAAIPVVAGTYTWVILADHALSLPVVTWYDRMIRVAYS